MAGFSLEFKGEEDKAISIHNTPLPGSYQHLLIHLQALVPENTCFSIPQASDVVLETRMPASQGGAETPTNTAGRSHPDGPLSSSPPCTFASKANPQAAPFPLPIAETCFVGIPGIPASCLPRILPGLLL